MRILSNLWNYRPDPVRYRALGARALRGLAFFLALMACFTVVSRAADSMTVAAVSAQTPSRGALLHSFKLDGEVEAVDSHPVLVPSGVRVEQVLVAEGDEVEAGDLLLVYDTSELQQQLSSGRLELQRLELQLLEYEAERQREAEQSEQEREREAAQTEQALARAAQDLDIAIERAQNNVSNAAADRTRARRELSDYDGDDESEEKALREAYRSAQRAFEAALLEQVETLQQHQRALEDAEELLRRALEDAGDEASSEYAVQSLAIDIQLKQMELSWLQQSVDWTGEVYAPVDGIVGSLDTAAGRMSSGEAALTLTGTGTLRVVAEVDEDQRKLLGQGASVALNGDDFERISGLSPSSIGAVEGRADRWSITIELPEESGLAPFQPVSVEVSRRSETYDLCVPLAALCQEGQNSYYLLVLGETETVTGQQTVARRVDVTLLDRNESLAAVSGALSGADRVIVASSKLLAPGDRVRLEA